MPKEQFPPGIFSCIVSCQIAIIGVVIKVNEKGYMNDIVLQEWVEECWIQRLNPSIEPSESLLIFDSARSHLTDDAKAALKER